MHGPINRTKVELKFSFVPSTLRFSHPINRTKVELKFVNSMIDIEIAIAYQSYQSGIEMKKCDQRPQLLCIYQSYQSGIEMALYPNDGPGSNLSINRTKVELKSRKYGAKQLRTEFYQSYQSGIEIRNEILLFQHLADYQSYQSGIEMVIPRDELVNLSGHYQSYQSGIEICYERPDKTDKMTINRTKVELKLSAGYGGHFRAIPINRTKVELK